MEGLNSKFRTAMKITRAQRRGLEIFNCFKSNFFVVCQNLVCLVCLV